MQSQESALKMPASNNHDVAPYEVVHSQWHGMHNIVTNALLHDLGILQLKTLPVSSGLAHFKEDKYVDTSPAIPQFGATSTFNIVNQVVSMPFWPDVCTRSKLG